MSGKGNGSAELLVVKLKKELQVDSRIADLSLPLRLFSATTIFSSEHISVLIMVQREFMALHCRKFSYPTVVFCRKNYETPNSRARGLDAGCLNSYYLVYKYVKNGWEKTARHQF